MNTPTPSRLRDVVLVPLIFVVGIATHLAVAPLVPLREVAEHVLEGERVAPELEERPALGDDETEQVAAQVAVLIAGELEGVRLLVGRKLGDAAHAGHGAQDRLHLGRRGGLASLGRLLVHRQDVADAARSRADVVERAVGDDAPLRDDDRARARRFDFGQVVGGEEDGALFADLFDVANDLGLFVRVEIARGLVEDEDGRVVNERLSEADALPVAVRERVDVLAEHLR